MLLLAAVLLPSGPVVAQRVATANRVATDRPAFEELLARHVTINVTRVPRRRAIDLVAANAKVPVQYQTQELDAYDDLITVHLADVSLGVALDRILAGTTLRVVPDGRTQLAVVEQGNARVMQATGAVVGRVIDSATTRGIANVTVAIRSTKVSTVTSADGRFTLSAVPVGDQVLTARLIGYRPGAQRIHVTSQTPASVAITLAPAATVLSGVVTTATGQQRRLEVGSDITILNADSIMKTAPITSVTDLLEGRVPGLTVVHSSGTPGDPARLRLRGAASIQGSNDPIVVVDGVRMYYTGANENGAASTLLVSGRAYPRPSPLDQIDPNSIQTIEVFKGPSASAMYGSDAANGVIVITTKQGRPGRTHWSLTGNTSTSSIPGSYPTITYSFGHLLTGGNSAGLFCNADGFSGTPCAVDSTISFQALNDPRYTPLTRGGGASGSATVSGGSQSLTYSLTGSMSNDRGMVKLPTASREQYVRFTGKAPPNWMMHPDSYYLWGLNGQVSAALSSTANVTVSNWISNSDQERTSLGLTGVGELIGQFVDTVRLGTNGLLNRFTEQATANTAKSTNAITLAWQARPWLHVNLTGGVDQQHGTDRTFQPSGLPEQLTGSAADSGGAYSLSRSSANVKTLNLNTSSTISLPMGKQLALSMGFNAQNTTQGSETIRTSFIPIGVTDPSGFVPNQTTSYQTTSAGSTFGWYVEPTLRLSERFFFSPGIRLDGGSASGGNVRFTGFPKMALSWVALDQSNANGGWRDVLSTLRLRGAYGYAGVQPGPADRLRLVSLPSVVLDGITPLPGVVINTQGNTKLRPERSAEMELGFDAEFLESRFSLTATYFHKKRLDAILSSLVASSVGGGGGVGATSSSSLGSQRRNIGTVRNVGLELDANAQLVRSDPFQWDVHVQTTSKSSKLLSFASGINGSPGAFGSRLAIGYPIDGIWVRPLEGYADLDHNGVIGLTEISMGDSAEYLGTQDAPFTSSFSSRVGLFNNRLSFNVQFDYQSGVTQYDALALTELQSAANAPNATLEEQAIYVASEYASVFSPNGLLTPRYLYQTVSMLRWNSMSVSYVLPTSFARALRGQAMTVSVQGSNLWLHTNYQGKDPNVNAETRGEGVTDFGQIPLPRTWVLRVTLTN
jgi:TonB-linked SusC/RagA family outer membrane protein